MADAYPQSSISSSQWPVLGTERYLLPFELEYMAKTQLELKTINEVPQYIKDLTSTIRESLKPMENTVYDNRERFEKSKPNQHNPYHALRNEVNGLWDQLEDFLNDCLREAYGTPFFETMKVKDWLKRSPASKEGKHFINLLETDIMPNGKSPNRILWIDDVTAFGNRLKEQQEAEVAG